MRYRFFITGTPRSRTAWLAAVFSTGPILCFHDPPMPMEELQRIYEGRSVGIASPLLVFQWERLRAEFPRTPWLYVERDPEDALASALVFLRPHYAAMTSLAPGVIEAGLRTVMERHRQASEAIKRSPGVKTVRFEDLDLPEVGREIWDHLIPGNLGDQARWKLMAGLRIEQHPQKALKQMGYLCQ